jgi:hypothetical protein
MELGNHSEFIDVMKRKEMFTNKQYGSYYIYHKIGGSLMELVAFA